MKQPSIRLNLIQNKISLGFLIVTLCFTVSILSVTSQLTILQKEIKHITEHDMNVHSLIQSIEKDLVDMESGQRGVAITGEAQYLDAYKKGKESWQHDYNSLLKLIDTPSSLEQLQEIEKNALKWIQVAGEKVISLNSEDDTQGIKQFFQTDPGKPFMDNLHHQLSTFQNSEKQLLTERIAVLENNDSQLRTQLYASLAIVIVVAVISSYFTGFLTARNVRKVVHAISEIASSGGDLTKRITVTTKDETKDLADQTNLLLSSLQSMITDIQANSRELKLSSSLLKNGASESFKASDQIAQSVQSVAQGAELQVSQTQEISAVIEETVSGLAQVASTATEVSSLAKRTKDVANQSAEEMGRNAATIGRIETTFTHIQASASELAQLSEQIRTVVSHIQNISNQTHLLSLNAAIEAARAGEHGRGFAVVAGEIRKLADQAAHSTIEINETIEVMLHGINGLVQQVDSNSHDVNHSVGAMKQAGEAFHKILEEVNDLSDQIAEVTEAVQQMSIGSQAAEVSIQKVNQITEEAASFSEEVAAMTEEQTATSQEMQQTAFLLSEMSDSLETLVSKFKV